VNLPAERGFLAFKDASGKQPPVTHFASFQPWDEKGTVTINQGSDVRRCSTYRMIFFSDIQLCSQGEDHAMLRVHITKGVLRFFENDVLKAILDTSYYRETHGNVD